MNLYAYCGNNSLNRTDPSGCYWMYFNQDHPESYQFAEFARNNFIDDDWVMYWCQLVEQGNTVALCFEDGDLSEANRPKDANFYFYLKCMSSEMYAYQLLLGDFYDPCYAHYLDLASNGSGYGNPVTSMIVASIGSLMCTSILSSAWDNIKYTAIGAWSYTVEAAQGIWEYRGLIGLYGDAIGGLLMGCGVIIPCPPLMVAGGALFLGGTALIISDQATWGPIASRIFGFYKQFPKYWEKFNSYLDPNN
jgi:hypothetical protein